MASGLFDPDWYLLTYPDVAAAGCDPLEHYMLHGAMELRHPGPLFDAPRYVAQNADDPAAARNPLLHFIVGGGTREQILTEAAIVASGLSIPTGTF